MIIEKDVTIFIELIGVYKFNSSKIKFIAYRFDLQNDFYHLIIKLKLLNLNNKACIFNKLFFYFKSQIF